MTDLLEELNRKKEKGEDLSFGATIEKDPNFEDFLKALVEMETDDR
jgi:hypothetical protein